MRVADALARLWLGGCDRVGPRASLRGHPFVQNLGRIEIGSDFVASSIPVPTHLVTGVEGRLTIGDRVCIAHGVGISAHCELTISDDTFIGPFAMILDSDYHDVQERHSPGVARPIRIGRRVRIGAGVIVLRGAIIGDDAVVAPNSVVSRFVPAGARVAGVPVTRDRSQDPRSVPAIG